MSYNIISKESLLYSNFTEQNTYTAGRSNIYLLKLVNNKFKKLYQENLLDKSHIEDIPFENIPGPLLNFHPKFKTDLGNRQLSANSCVQKRKLEDFEMDKNKFQNDTLSQFPLKLDSSYLKEKNHWEQYTSLKPYNIKSYSSLLPKTLISNFMDKNKFPDQTDLLSSLHSTNLYSSVHRNKPLSLFFVEKCLNSQTVEENINIFNAQNINRNSKFDTYSKHVSKENKLISKCKKITNVINYSTESLLSTQMHHEKNLFFPKSTSAVKSPNKINQTEVNTTYAETFTTAAGKSISISNKAILAAHRFIQSMSQDEMLQKIDRDSHCSSIEKKQFMKQAIFKNVISCATRKQKDDKIITGNIDSKSIENNHELCINHDAVSADFSTGTGKKINVSETAMKAAHKLIQDAFENEDKTMPSTSGITCKKKSSFQDIGSPPKKLMIEDNDNIMDEDIVEKFFQDAVFDEKESEDITNSNKNKDSNKGLESRKNKPATHKIRKSLGGRRSMTFYSGI